MTSSWSVVSQNFMDARRPVHKQHFHELITEVVFALQSIFKNISCILEMNCSWIIQELFMNSNCSFRRVIFGLFVKVLVTYFDSFVLMNIAYKHTLGGTYNCAYFKCLYLFYLWIFFNKTFSERYWLNF